MNGSSDMDKQAAETNQVTRTAAETQRRWDEVRQMREQVMSRQDQVLQQTSADVRRHVERMRHVRASIVAPSTAVRSTAKPEPQAEPKPTSSKLQPIPNGPRFDFDSRRIAWEQRRREQAEKRQAEMERIRAPYLEQRRMLEEKRRQALEQQAARRSMPVAGSHQMLPSMTKSALTSNPVAAAAVVERLEAVEDKSGWRQTSMFGDDGDANMTFDS